MADDLNFKNLKQKQRELREGFPINLGLRVHRALSWMDRAERETEDHDAQFLFYWIAFNAAYAEDIDALAPKAGRTAFGDYFQRILELDTEHRVHSAIWDRFSGAVRVFLENRYVFQPFWSHQNGVAGNDDWEPRFAKSRKRGESALMNRDTQTVLTILFDRLYVLRNQLMHGGATWNSSVNREQVRDGAAIIGFLVPTFVDLMMDHPDLAWGAPYYPVVE